MPRALLPLLLALLSGVWVACNPASPSTEASPEPAPQHRIVSLGGGVTETLFALGLGPSIVAVDTSSIWPEAVEALPKVGYLRNASAEGILSAAPTHVVASSELGPPNLADQLRGAGVTLLLAPEHRSVAGAKERIKTLAQHFDAQGRADALIKDIDETLAALAAKTAQLSHRPRVLFIYARGAGNIMIAGAHSGPDHMISLAGGEIAVDAFEGFRPITAEAVLAAQPDVILLPSRGLESLGGVNGLSAIPGLSPTSFDRPPKVIHLDDALLLSFGPRVALGAHTLFDALHPAEGP